MDETSLLRRGLRFFASTLVILTVVAAAPQVLALPESDFSSEGPSDSDEMGYDAIVSSLNRQVNTTEAPTVKARAPRAVSADPFENVWMHGGAGYVQNVQSLDLPGINKNYLNQKGVQASLGLDLFSTNWTAEGSVRSFNDNEDREAQVSLKEFELKVFFKNRFARSFQYRIGGGISGRYMTVTTPDRTFDFSTPSSVATLGLDFFITDRFSLGADFSGRSAMISDTIDRGSIDGTLRLDAHF